MRRAGVAAAAAMLVGGLATTAGGDPNKCVCAPPPSHAPGEHDAEAVAQRWLQAVLTGDGAAAARAMAADAAVATAPCAIRRTASRAEVIHAAAVWRTCLPFRPDHWRTTTIADDWREVTTRIDGESFGTLTVRVGRDLAIRGVTIAWSQGGI